VLDGLDEWPALAQLDAFLAPAAPQDGADAADPARAARDGDPSTAAIRAPTDGFVMGCDFPFGLPRPFVDALAAHGPDALRTTLAHGLSDQQTPPVDTLIHSLYAHVVDRAGFQRLIDDWGVGWHADRPSGGKLIHRPTDAAWPSLHSTSPLQTRYVPVGKMYFEGLWRLVRADLTLPGLRQGRPRHVALEAWPGLLAAQVFGKARSYKSDTDATPERLIARMDAPPGACASSCARPSASTWCKTPKATAWTPCSVCCKPPGPTSRRRLAMRTGVCLRISTRLRAGSSAAKACRPRRAPQPEHDLHQARTAHHTRCAQTKRPPASR